MSLITSLSGSCVTSSTSRRPARGLGRVAAALVAAAGCAEMPEGTELEAAEAFDSVEGAAVTPADLNVALTGPAAVNAGATAAFQLSTTNLGGAPAASSRVDVSVPAGYTPSGLSSGCTWLSSSRTIRCSFGTINAGATRTGSYNLTMPAAAGTLSQRATSYTSATESGYGNNALWLHTAVLGADLAVALTGPASAVGGGTATYTATASNSGILAASNASITINLPQGFFPSATGGCQVLASPQRLRCSVGSIAPGGSVSRTFTYGVPYDVTAINLTASAAGATAEPALTNGNNTVSVVTPVSAPVPVAVTLSVPTPQGMTLTNCFGDPGDFGSFAACDPAWLQSGQVTFLAGGVIDTGDPSITGTWSQPSGPESIEVEFNDATTGDLVMFMDGFGVSNTCFEGLNYWPGETSNRGAFQLCTF